MTTNKIFSRKISDLLNRQEAVVTVVDPFKCVDFRDADFNQLVPLGEGSQGLVYAVMIHLCDDPNEYRFVIKSIKERKRLPRFATSQCQSASSFAASFAGSFCTDAILDSAKTAAVKIRKKRNKDDFFHSHRNITRDHDSLSEHNIIKLIDTIKQDDGTEYALLPYCDIFLDTFFEKHFHDLDLKTRLILICEIMLDVLNAITYLNYEVDYVHRDIKLDNIARFDDKWCIIDFESAVPVGSKDAEFTGSPYFVHPACFADSEKTAWPGNDMYALGQVLRKLLMLPADFQSETTYGIFREKLEVYKKEIHDKWSDGITKEYPTGTSGNEERIIMISEKMCSLMSDQPPIDDVFKEFECIYLDLKKIEKPVSNLSDSSSILTDLYKSSRSDGYFSSSTEGKVTFMQETCKEYTKKRNSIYANVEFSSDDDDLFLFDHNNQLYHPG